MVQIASAKWRLGQRDEAISGYKEARSSELRWGQRKNKNVSEYIVRYCEYCIRMIQLDPSTDDTLVEDYAKLKSLNVPEAIRNSKLPLPKSPSGNYL